MEEKKKKMPNTTITRNTAEFSQMTGNIYETVAVLTKRANQIAAEEKRELHRKAGVLGTSFVNFFDSDNIAQKFIVGLAGTPRRTSSSSAWKRWKKP